MASKKKNFKGPRKECPFCKQEFNAKYYKSFHIYMCNKSPNQTTVCHKCSKECGKNLLVHLRKCNFKKKIEHNFKISRMTCPFCEENFSSVYYKSFHKYACKENPNSTTVCHKCSEECGKKLLVHLRNCNFQNNKKIYNMGKKPTEKKKPVNIQFHPITYHVKNTNPTQNQLIEISRQQLNQTQLLLNNLQLNWIKYIQFQLNQQQINQHNQLMLSPQFNNQTTTPTNNENVPNLRKRLFGVGLPPKKVLRLIL